MSVVHVFFFKQKTAYEMRISDWSSDVCSSDLTGGSLTYDGTIAGTGGLIKTGVGTLTLNGMNTYTGDTTVGAGTLEVGDAAHPLASLQRDVLVDAGGMLRGHGTITGIAANNGGIVRPGGSIGTFTIFVDSPQPPTGTLMNNVTPAA